MVEGAGTSGDHRRFFSASADGGAWPTGAAMGSRAKRRKDQISAVVSSAYAQTGPLLRTVRSSWSNLGRRCGCLGKIAAGRRSEEHTSELQSIMRISYADFCLKKNTTNVKTKK